MPKRGGVRVPCPKCGQEGWLIVKRIKGREYLYVDHYVADQDGRKRHVQHYVGLTSENPELASLVVSKLSAETRAVISSYQRDVVSRVISKPSGLVVELTPEEVEAFYVKVVEKVGKSKYDPKKHRGMSWDEVNEAWASLKSKVLAMR